jgi:hypothetical protein
MGTYLFLFISFHFPTHLLSLLFLLWHRINVAVGRVYGDVADGVAPHERAVGKEGTVLGKGVVVAVPLADVLAERRKRKRNRNGINTFF